jgi:hypothetical protein
MGASFQCEGIFVDPSRIDPSAGWERAPVAEIFATELLPIMDSKPKLQRIFEDAVADWVADSPWMKKRAGRWRYASHKNSPFMLTYSDGAVMYVEQLIDDAYEADDPLAHAYYAMMTLLTDETDQKLSAATIREMQKRVDAIWRDFEPPRDSARYWAPFHSCHTFALPALCLAHEWRPEGQWRILSGDLHSTVIDLKSKLVFDLVLCEDHATDAVAFACRAAPTTDAAPPARAPISEGERSDV